MRNAVTFSAVLLLAGMIACSDCNAPETTSPAAPQAEAPRPEPAPPIRPAPAATAGTETAESPMPERKDGPVSREPGPERDRPRAEPREATDEELAAIKAHTDRFDKRTNFRDELKTMTTDDALDALEDEAQRAFESAHYEFERGSTSTLAGRTEPVRGELSLVDCSLAGDRDYDGPRTLWIGGLELRDADEIFEPQISGSKKLSLTPRNHVLVSGSFSDLHLTGGTLKGMRRTLDADIESRGPNEVTVHQLELYLDPARTSTAELERSNDLCPERLTLHFVLQETRALWTIEPSGSTTRARQTRVEESAPVAHLTLEAEKVSNRAQLFDPAQRTPRPR